jgi:hypothetical protein
MKFHPITVNLTKARQRPTPADERRIKKIHQRRAKNRLTEADYDWLHQYAVDRYAVTFQDLTTIVDPQSMLEALILHTTAHGVVMIQCNRLSIGEFLLEFSRVLAATHLLYEEDRVKEENEPPLAPSTETVQ